MQDIKRRRDELVTVVLEAEGMYEHRSFQGAEGRVTGSV